MKIKEITISYSETENLGHLNKVKIGASAVVHLPHGYDGAATAEDVIHAAFRRIKKFVQHEIQERIDE